MYMHVVSLRLIRNVLFQKVCIRMTAWLNSVQKIEHNLLSIKKTLQHVIENIRNKVNQAEPVICTDPKFDHI